MHGHMNVTKKKEHVWDYKTLIKSVYEFTAKKQRRVSQ